jgi:hypothetical protein
MYRAVMATCRDETLNSLGKSPLSKKPPLFYLRHGFTFCFTGKAFLLSKKFRIFPEIEADYSEHSESNLEMKSPRSILALRSLTASLANTKYFSSMEVSLASGTSTPSSTKPER